MAASGHRLARFARPVDNPAGQADGQAAPAHELAHRDCPPAPQPSPTYPPAPTARPSALLHQVLIFSGGKSLRPSAFGLRASLAGWTPSGRRVKARAATAQRLGLDATETTQPMRVGAVEGRSPPACPPEPHGGECGESRGAAPRWARPKAAQSGGTDAPPRWGGTLCRRGSRAEGVGEPRRGAPLKAPKQAPRE